MSTPEVSPNPPANGAESRRPLNTRQWLLILNFCVALAVFGQYLSGVSGRTLLVSAVASFLSLNVSFLIARKYGKEEGPGPGHYPMWAMAAIAVGLLLLSVPTREGRWKRAVQSAEKAFMQRQLPEAEKQLNAALQIAQKFGPADKHVIATLNQLLLVYEVQGKTAQVEATLRRIADLQQRANDPAEADTLSKLAVFYLGRNQADKAEQALKRALQVREKTPGPQSTEYARALANLAVPYRTTGKFDEAEALYKRAIEVLEKDGKAAGDLSRTLVSFGELRAQQRRYGDAKAMFERALEINEKSAGKETADSAPILKLLGELAIAQQNPAAAEPLLQRALGLQQGVYAGHSPAAGSLCLELGWIYEQRGDHARAEGLFRHAGQVAVASYGLYHPETARALAAIGTVYWKQGKYVFAEAPLSRALQIYEKVLGPKHPLTISLTKTYEQFLKDCPRCGRTSKSPQQAPDTKRKEAG